jgi:hypothetical protein
MKYPYFFLVVLLIPLVSVCSSDPFSSPNVAGHSITLKTSVGTATFVAPNSWKVTEETRFDMRRSTELSVVSTTSPKAIIEIIFGPLDPTAAPNPEGQINAYVAAVRSHTDAEVISKKYSVITSALGERIPVYYLHSDYFGHRLYSVYVSGNVGISAELYVDSKKSVQLYQGIFSALVTSFSITK